MEDSHFVLHSESGNQLTTYNGEDMQTYYNMLRPTKYENNDFYIRWVDLNTSDIINYWCREPAKFHHDLSIVYTTRIHKDVN